MAEDQRSARIFGVLFLITFITSIPALALYRPVLDSGLILGYLMYSSRLVPRGMARLGLIGGPLIILSGIGTLFDWWDAGSTVPAITVIPESLGAVARHLRGRAGIPAGFSDPLADRCVHEGVAASARRRSHDSR